MSFIDYLVNMFVLIKSVLSISTLTSVHCLLCQVCQGQRRWRKSKTSSKAPIVQYSYNVVDVCSCVCPV